MVQKEANLASGAMLRLPCGWNYPWVDFLGKPYLRYTLLNGLKGGKHSMKLEIGMTAPDFKLMSHLDKDVTLSHLRGHNVILAFFPLAWTPV